MNTFVRKTAYRTNLYKLWHWIGGAKKELILIEDLKLIYFPTPKVANTSIRWAIVNHLDIDIGNKKIRNVFPTISKKEFLNTYYEYNSFAFVRNPFDRLVSCYKEKIQDKNLQAKNHINGVANLLYKYNTMFKTVFYPDMSFKDFVYTVCKISDIKADKHFKSQFALFSDKNLTILPEYIGYFEKLDEDFNEIMKKIGVNNISIPETNSSNQKSTVKHKKKSYKDFYTKELADMVYKRYQKDFDLWYPNAYNEMIEYLDN